MSDLKVQINLDLWQSCIFLTKVFKNLPPHPHKKKNNNPIAFYIKVYGSKKLTLPSNNHGRRKGKTVTKSIALEYPLMNSKAHDHHPLARYKKCVHNNLSISPVLVERIHVLHKFCFHLLTPKVYKDRTCQSAQLF